MIVEDVLFHCCLALSTVLLGVLKWFFAIFTKILVEIANHGALCRSHSTELQMI